MLWTLTYVTRDEAYTRSVIHSVNKGSLTSTNSPSISSPQPPILQGLGLSSMTDMKERGEAPLLSPASKEHRLRSPVSHTQVQGRGFYHSFSPAGHLSLLETTCFVTSGIKSEGLSGFLSKTHCALTLLCFSVLMLSLLALDDQDEHCNGIWEQVWPQKLAVQLFPFNEEKHGKRLCFMC